jgi:Polysulphide reductase, NrfD
MPGEIATEPAVVTKAPPWHGWVVADLFFSSLAAGLYAVGAIAILARAQTFAPAVRIGFLIVFPTMLADLACLIGDLGDPARFHHMLRLFKPGSPMSLGVWSISAFTTIAFAAWVLALTGASAAVMRIVAAVGLLPALMVAVYKGVLFSATAQPRWRRMRWLGAVFSISAATMGAAALLAIAFAAGRAGALDGLFDLFAAALLLNLFAMGRLLPAFDDFAGTRAPALRVLGFRLLQYLGNLLPLVLLNPWKPGAMGAWLALSAVLLNAIAFRYLIVMMPHGDA